MKGDDIWLSPAYGGDRCFIGIIMYRPYGKEVPYEQYFELVQAVMEELGAPPSLLPPPPLSPSPPSFFTLPS